MGTVLPSGHSAAVRLRRLYQCGERRMTQFLGFSWVATGMVQPMTYVCRFVGSVALAAVVLLAAACGGSSSEDALGDGARGAAAEAFVTCAEARGAGVAEIEMGDEGVETLLFTSETPEELYDVVASECERAAVQVLDGERSEDEPEPDVPGLPTVPSGVSSIDEYLNHLASEAFSGAVLVGDRTDVEVASAFGEADRERGEPVTTETAFDVGSVAKHFTAVAVLRLTESETVTLESTLGELLVGVPGDNAGITLGELLAHRSGLGEYHDTEGDFEEMTRAEALDAIFAQELRFEPGTDTAYSNSGYTVLAAVVEHVTGRSFRDVLGELFDLAGMEHTGFYGSDELARVSVAKGYEGLEVGENSPASWPPVSWALLGSGGIASSVEDLHRWFVAVHDGTLLDPAVEELYYDRILERPELIDGVELAAIAGGNDYGFEVTVVESLDAGEHVIVATNANDPTEMASTEAALVVTQLLVDQGR